ncbi:MAG: DUF92 domain-containing protein [Anaerolineales bacterium]|nr:DUF92 domain-containing protein [Anaerolineales bacterium]
MALLLGAGVAGLAWWAGLLQPSGAAAATLVGAAAFGGSGWRGAGLVLAFFLSSGVLSRWGAQRKRVLQPVMAKSGRRDAWQVAANGGVAAVLSLAYGLSGSQAEVFLVGMVGALAAVNADTWATEIGVLSSPPPRLLTGGRIVPPGTSGGVTAAGLLASLAGAGLISALAAWFWGRPALLGIGLLAGMLGSLLDSLLGATAQAVYHCPACGVETEQHPRHTCGAATQRLRGLAWLGNDTVNLLCSLSGAVLAMTMWRLAVG